MADDRLLPGIPKNDCNSEHMLFLKKKKKKRKK